jgi:hypothetical protein
MFVEIDWQSVGEGCLRFYAASLRSPLFTSMLTLSGLVFAIHNFLVINLQKEVYSKPTFRKYARLAEPNRHPLDRLLAFSERCQRAAMVCFGSALVQFTIGFVPHWSASAVAVFSAIAAVVTLVKLHFLQKQTIDGWFQFLRVDYDREDRDVVNERERVA